MKKVTNQATFRVVAPNTILWGANVTDPSHIAVSIACRGAVSGLPSLFHRHG